MGDSTEYEIVKEPDLDKENGRDAVQFELVEVLSEADDGGRVIGVHHPNLLALEEAFVPGMFLLLGAELDVSPARLVLYGSLLRLR